MGRVVGEVEEVRRTADENRIVDEEEMRRRESRFEIQLREQPA